MPVTLGSLKICGKGSGAGVGATYWRRLTTRVAPLFIWSADAVRPMPLASSTAPQSRPKPSGRKTRSDRPFAIIMFPLCCGPKADRHRTGFRLDTLRRCQFDVKSDIQSKRLQPRIRRGRVRITADAEREVTTVMKWRLAMFATAMPVLFTLFAAQPAYPQKPGGVLKISFFDN